MKPHETQLKYLNKTQKPTNMSVKAWINRVENINSYSPLIKEDVKPLTGNSIISEIIYKNLPSIRELQFKLHGLHKQTSINAIIPALIILEENIKPEANTNGSNQNKKQGQDRNLKNPYRLHGGNHEWDHCRQNPKNKKEDDS